MIAMLPRLINVQGAFGIAASLCLLGLLLVQKSETRHWREQSHGFEKLYRGEQQAHAQTIANYRAAAETARRAAPTPPTASGCWPTSRTLAKGRSMTMKLAWPMLALTLTACGAKPERQQTIAALAEQRLCPPPALPPLRLMVAPRKADFLLQID